jgi:hypothetical protein
MPTRHPGVFGGLKPWVSVIGIEFVFEIAQRVARQCGAVGCEAESQDQPDREQPTSERLGARRHVA